MNQDPNPSEGQESPPDAVRKKSWFHACWRDRALRFQTLKVLLLSLLLAIPLHSPKAVAKKQAAKPEAQTQTPAMVAEVPPPIQEKKPPKLKKDKKTEETEDPFANHLTSETGRKLLHVTFPVPPGLKTAVDFWKMVYTKYDRNYEIFHDTEDLSIVYSVLDFNDLAKNPSLSEQERHNIRRARVQEEKDRILTILNRLAQGVNSTKELSLGELAVYKLFKDNPDPDSFRAAMDEGRLRSQVGIRDNFINGLKSSGAYLEDIENIFNSYDLPVELSRLAFVESMFNLRAVSKVGASGIWQFMPSTGRLYLNIDSVTDERNDPIQASHAAAKLLKSNFDALGSWPLAINAYNSGRATMKSAVRSLGTTDIATIIQFYRGGVYGFASRNFYACFLAALEVSNHYEKYFGKVQRQAPLRSEYFILKWPAYLNDLASQATTPWATLQDMNPNFSQDILAGNRKIPAGYFLRIPRGTQGNFAQAEELLHTQAMQP